MINVGNVKTELEQAKATKLKEVWLRKLDSIVKDCEGSLFLRPIDKEYECLTKWIIGSLRYDKVLKNSLLIKLLIVAVDRVAKTGDKTGYVAFPDFEKLCLLPDENFTAQEQEQLYQSFKDEIGILQVLLEINLLSFYLHQDLEKRQYILKSIESRQKYLRDSLNTYITSFSIPNELGQAEINSDKFLFACYMWVVFTQSLDPKMFQKAPKANTRGRLSDISSVPASDRWEGDELPPEQITPQHPDFLQDESKAINIGEKAVISFENFRSLRKMLFCNLTFSKIYRDEKKQGKIIISGLTFYNCSFTDLDMSNIQFEYCTFKGCKFNNCILKSSIFTNVKMNQCKFSECDLEEIKLYDCYLYSCNFDKNKMVGAEIKRTDCQSCQFVAANLFKANINDSSSFTECNFNNANLQSAILATDKPRHDGQRFVPTTFEKCTYKDALLVQTWLKKIHLRECTFENANFNSALLTQLTSTNCAYVNADFTHTVWHDFLTTKDKSQNDFDEQFPGGTNLDKCVYSAMALERLLENALKEGQDNEIYAWSILAMQTLQNASQHPEQSREIFSILQHLYETVKRARAILEKVVSLQDLMLFRLHAQEMARLKLAQEMQIEMEKKKQEEMRKIAYTRPPSLAVPPKASFFSGFNPSGTGISEWDSISSVQDTVLTLELNALRDLHETIGRGGRQLTAIGTREAIKEKPVVQEKKVFLLNTEHLEKRLAIIKNYLTIYEKTCQKADTFFIIINRPNPAA